MMLAAKLALWRIRLQQRQTATHSLGNQAPAEARVRLSQFEAPKHDALAQNDE